MSELQIKSLFNPEFSQKMHQRIDIRSHMALKEFGQKNWKLNHSDGFQDISIQELRRVGHRIADCKNIWEVYSILGETSNTGVCYYDVIMKPQHDRAYSLMDSILTQMEPTSVEHALDIATGTGEMALVLGKRAKKTTAIDLTTALMESAQKKLMKAQKQGKIGDFSLQIMDVLNLDLPVESVDIAMANGLQAYLTNEEVLIMMEQLRRVLKKGGRYYEYQADNPDPLEYKTSQRAYLVGEIAAAIVGQTLTRQNAKTDQKLHLEGFDVTSLNIVNKNDPRKYKEILLRCIKK